MHIPHLPSPPFSPLKLRAQIQHRILLPTQRLKIRKEVLQGGSVELSLKLIPAVEEYEYRGASEPRGVADGVEEFDVRLQCGAGRVHGGGLVVAGEVGDKHEGGYVGGLGEGEWEVRDGSGSGWDIEDAVGESVVPQVKLPDTVGGGGGDRSVLRLDLASAANAAQDFGFPAVRGTERQDDEVGGLAGKRLGWDGLAVAL